MIVITVWRLFDIVFGNVCYQLSATAVLLGFAADILKIVVVDKLRIFIVLATREALWVGIEVIPCGSSPIASRDLRCFGFIL